MDPATTALPLARFVLQAAVILLVARVLGLIMRRLGQPQVVAEIIAGILLGPSLLGWLAPDAFEVLFAPSSLDVLQVLSNVGLVLFMFQVGVEVDPRLLRGRGRASVAIAYSNLVGPFILAIPLALVLHDLYAAKADLWIFVLFVGATLAISAFAVLARMLTDHGILRTPVGTLAITSAAVGDVVLWCLIAFIVAASRASGLDAAFITLGLTLAFVLAVFFAARPLLVGLSRTATAASGPSHNIVALVLVMVFVASWVTEQIGIHALFGAFAVGVILPRQGGFARVLAEKLEGIVVVLFLPLFFAYSGLRTELDLLATPTDWLVMLAVTAVACIGKLGSNALAARATGMTWREAGALGVIMNTRGLIELVVLNIGLDLGLLSPTLFTMLVLMALITTLMTAPLLRRVYPSHELARSLIEAVSVSAGAAARPAPYKVAVQIDDPRQALELAHLAHLISGPAGSIDAIHLVTAEEAERHFEVVDDEKDATALDVFLTEAYRVGADPRPLSFVSAEPESDVRRLVSLRAPNLLLRAAPRDIVGEGLAQRGNPRLETSERQRLPDVSRGLACPVACLHGDSLPPPKEVWTFAEDADDGLTLEIASGIAERAAVALRVAPGPTAEAAARGDGVLWVLPAWREEIGKHLGGARLVVSPGAADGPRVRSPRARPRGGEKSCTLALP